MLLVKVFQAFNRLKVRYLVVGGVASVLYGNPRFTKDLDIWVDPDTNNLEKVVQAFKKLKFIPRVPVKPEDFISEENRRRWKKEKGMLAFTFINPKVPLENIDLLFEGLVTFSLAFKKKKVFKSGQVSVYTISRTDLIAMKQAAGRPQDLQDVKILKAVGRKGKNES